jgi:hypothetical protein
MKTRWGAVAVLALGVAAFAGEHPEHPKATAGALDKKVFTGQIKEASSEKADKDELRFDNGKFVSSAFKRYGFTAAPYTASETDGVVSFSASPTNDKGETMLWTGTVKGNVLEATAVHKTSAGETTYRYTGTAVASKAKEPKKKSEHPEHPR